ncbi:MAG: serpin family protein, partial [Elusimicrobia bacterium]|nr:serpin family protein [Elusimicrobiota bacterium]
VSALKAAYRAECRKRFEAVVENVDFRRAADKVALEINAWAARATQGRIQGLIPSGTLTAATRMVLANAVYFKGDWADKFDESRTREGDFAAEGGKTVKVPFMSRKGDLRFAKKDGLAALELPYKGRKLSMLVLLPDAPDGLAAMEQSLDAAELAGVDAALRPEEVLVALPRFQMETSLELSDPLKALGLGAAFGSDADFSGMTGAKDFSIDAVLQKAFVKVDEEGTEAAAATAVVMKATSFRPPVLFRADRPFLFLIRDARGEVLFAGRVADPG